MKNNAKVIFHIDLNQFFCSVAIIKNPRLKGKAFAIGRENTIKGVISTASYEARKYGINSGMPLIDAYKKLPSLLVVHYNYELYSEYSHKFFALIGEYVKDIEQTSVDEGFIDVTAITIKINRHPIDLAKEIQTRALNELQLPCSIGIAPTLFLAKMASDLKKPLGITVLRIRDVPKLLYPLKVSDIYGVGKKKIPYFNAQHIETIGDFVNPKNEAIVRKIVGSGYDYFLDCLKGKSTNIVNPNRYGEPESMSRSVTFDNPLLNVHQIMDEIFALSDYLNLELEKYHKKTKTIGITFRDTNFKTITRSRSLQQATNDKTIIRYHLEDLIEENYDLRPLRLIGVSYSHLEEDERDDFVVTLFNYEEVYKKEEALNQLMKDFDKRYGDKSLFFGNKLSDE